MVNEKQDRVRLRKAEDLERKYNLTDLQKSVQKNETEIFKVNAEAKQFADATTKEFADMQKQLDGKIETYYYAGVPTLENEPASGWSEDTYSNHVGDLYYDTDTGSPYRFMFTNDIYGWQKVNDTELAQILAVANAAKDTADRKRQVFVATPSPPYDEGDLWVVNYQEIYVCKIAKETGEYESGDFVPATDFNDRIDSNTGEIVQIHADIGEIKELRVSDLETINANISGKLTANVADISEAWIKELMVQGKLLADQGTIFELVGVHISGDLIDANTLKADRLLLRNSTDGLYYQLNVDGTTSTEGYTEEELNNGLLGTHIIAESITVEQITTRNLEGTGGWINLHEGKFNYGTIDAGGKGISWDGNDLLINADNIQFGASNRSLNDVDNTATQAKDGLSAFQTAINIATSDASISINSVSGNEVIATPMRLTGDNITFESQTKKGSGENEIITKNKATLDSDGLTSRVANVQAVNFNGTDISLIQFGNRVGLCRRRR